MVGVRRKDIIVHAQGILIGFTVEARFAGLIRIPEELQSIAQLQEDLNYSRRIYHKL